MNKDYLIHIGKLEKVVAIIKTKHVDFYDFIFIINEYAPEIQRNIYNRKVCDLRKLTQEEFDILKEEFK